MTTQPTLADLQRDAFAVYNRRDDRARQRLVAASDIKPEPKPGSTGPRPSY